MFVVEVKGAEHRNISKKQIFKKCLHKQINLFILASYLKESQLFAYK